MPGGVTAQVVGAFQITARGGKQGEVFEHTIIKKQCWLNEVTVEEPDHTGML